MTRRLAVELAGAIALLLACVILSSLAWFRVSIGLGFAGLALLIVWAGEQIVRSIEAIPAVPVLDDTDPIYSAGVRL